MNGTNPSSSALLRAALAADGAVSAMSGLVMAAGAGVLADPLGVPEPLLRWAGIGLLPFAAFVLWAATRESVPAGAVRAIVVCNALWALDSVLLLLSGWIAPTTMGAAFVAIQAAGVAVLAELQYVGLRRSMPLAA
ncbi:MAG: hypothetical protein AB7P02_01390 [Alphaproteobacteria bacterium]